MSANCCVLPNPWHFPLSWGKVGGRRIPSEGVGEDKLEPILSPKTSVPPRAHNAASYGSAQLLFSFTPTFSQRIPQQISNWKLENPHPLPWH